MILQERIKLLAQLRAFILEDNQEIDDIAHRAFAQNAWFTVENIKGSLRSIATAFLDQDLLTAWAESYKVQDQNKRVGLVLAGNIPMVGFHDILSVFVSGNISLIKLSEKDNVLIPYIIKKLSSWNAESAVYFEIVDRLTGMDAVIATGSNNTARYFEQYFGKYPNIIRKNRNGIAILNGKETEEDLQLLAEDVFKYFGLGCRNVSKIYVPVGYNTDIIMKAFETQGPINDHNKYGNNYDYTLALWLLNKVVFKQNNCFLLQEHPLIPSRIATVNFEYYEDIDTLSRHLLADRKEEIQCIVSQSPIDGFKSFYFGAAQKPSLMDYADGVDTMQFLASL